MEFTNSTLDALMTGAPDGPETAAKMANLCMEERVSAGRQAAYEHWIGDLDGWDGWQELHHHYVEEEVRRRHPLSAAFTGGEPSLRPDIEPNQHLYRVERIDRLLAAHATTTGVPVGAEQVNAWIAARDAEAPSAGTVAAFADLGRLIADVSYSPKVAALHESTDLLNEERSDGRPSFVAFSAEFPGLETRADWARNFCERCGLAHFFADCPVTLALFRYRVQEVVEAHAAENAAVFAVPTAIDQPMSNVYFAAPGSMPWGHAVGLAPEPDCGHLAAELIHARMDYRAEHWVAVGTLETSSLSVAEIARYRQTHLDCIRRSPGHSDYGRNC